MSGASRLHAVVAVVVVALVTATLQELATSAAAAAQQAPTTSTPPSASAADDGFVEGALRGEGQAPATEFGFVFLGRPGPVAAGFNRYYWMTAAGLGVQSACSGSHTSAGHCTWAEYYWARTGTAGGSYLSGDAVPMYFDHRGSTVRLVFGPDAAVESGVWSGTQAGFGATVAVACAAHDLFRVDDWPPSDRHDDIWHDVVVCEARLPDMAETDGTASIPTRPDDVEVHVLAGSDPLSRAGLHTELTLELRRPSGFVYRSGAEPVRASVPIAGASIGITVTHGPSAAAAVMCLVPPSNRTAAPRYSSSCATDTLGQATVRYLVPADAAHALRRGRDTLVIFEDRDRDGAHDHRPGSVGHEPAAALDIPVAKAVNYIALGDSYSSGEVGRPDTEGFVGSYQNGVSPADSHCRRWSEAYPNVVTRDLLGDGTLGINVSFATFACTGAITHNIHDPRGIGEDVTQEDLIATNKPSHPVPSLSYDSDTGQLLPRPSDWEPRQAVSLANAQAMNEVDMITITIGGNDTGFADVIRACATPLIGNLDSTCNQDDLALSWAEVQDRIEDALTKIRAASPRASIYALGYPPITPRPTPCPSDVRDCPELGINRLIDECPALSAQDILAHSAGVESLPAVFRPLGYLARWSPLGIAASVNGLSLDEIASGIAKIDHVEADFLWSSAGALNRAVQRAAAAAGVHFVDIRSGDQFASSTGSLVGHDPCGADPWLHGFVLDMEQTPASAKSFHPNVAGHAAYARSLEQYIRAQIVAGADLSEAGLPANPKAASR